VDANVAGAVSLDLEANAQGAIKEIVQIQKTLERAEGGGQPRLAGGLSEQPLVLAAELRGVLVAHPVAGTGGIQVLAEHQAPGLLEPELLLELQRAHRRDRLEVVVKIGGSDPSAPFPHQQAVGHLIRPQRRRYRCPGIEARSVVTEYGPRSSSKYQDKVKELSRTKRFRAAPG
jgi:hypothetical protein